MENENKNIPYIDPDLSEDPFDDVIFGVSSIASANECTGMGRGFPLSPDETEGLTEICELHMPQERMEADLQ